MRVVPHKLASPDLRSITIRRSSQTVHTTDALHCLAFAPSFVRSLSTTKVLVFSMTPKSGIVIGLIILGIRLGAWFRAELHFRQHVGWVGVSNTLKLGTIANDGYIRMSLGMSIPASNRSISSFTPGHRQSHPHSRSSIDSDDTQ